MKKRKPKVIVVFEKHTPGQRKKVVEMLKGARKVVLETTKEALEKPEQNVHFSRIAEELKKKGVEIIPGDVPPKLKSEMDVEEYAKEMIEKREKNLAATAAREAKKSGEPVYLVVGAGHTGVIQELKKKGVDVKGVKAYKGNVIYDPGTQLARIFRFKVQGRYLPEEMDIIAEKLAENEKIFQDIIDLTKARVPIKKGEYDEKALEKYDKVVKQLAKEGLLKYPKKEILMKRRKLDAELEKQDPSYKKIKERVKARLQLNKKLSGKVLEERTRLEALKTYREYKEKEYLKAFEKIYGFD